MANTISKICIVQITIAELILTLLKCLHGFTLQIVDLSLLGLIKCTDLLFWRLKLTPSNTATYDDVGSQSSLN